MKSRFIKLWEGIDAKSNPITEFNKLSLLYSKKRYYHSISHIQMCLQELDYFKKLNKETYNFDLIELAIWYHDVIYDTRNTNSEERSAEYAVRVCNKAKLSATAITKVKKLILSTKFKNKSENKNERLLQDIDICIFGQSKKIFDEYEKNIRKEYLWVPLERYREGRIKVLKYFLDRKYIYNTEIFRKKYEQKAKTNLKQSIKKLSIK